MKATFTQIKESRLAFLRLVEGLSTAQLNQVPPGFNNNLIWNLGHILVATVGLCYKRNQVQPDKPIPLGPKYAKGTKPEGFTDAAEIDSIKTQLLTTIEELEKDYYAGVFANGKPFATATYQYTMHTIEEVIACTLAHDNFHYGYAVALKRFIQ